MTSPYGPPQGGAPQGQQGPSGPYGPPPGQWGPGPGQGGPGPMGGPGQGGSGPMGHGGPQGSGGQQGPGGPQGGYGQPAYAPAAPKKPLDLGKILPMAVAGLALLNFIWGFLPFTGYDSTYGSVSNNAYSGLGWLPALFLIAGMLAIGPMLPKAPKASYAAAVISVVAALLTLISLISAQGVKIGFILMLIFGLIQAAAAVALWLFDAGVMKATASGSVSMNPQQFSAQMSQTGGYGPGGPGGQSPQGQQPGFSGPAGYSASGQGHSGGSGDGQPGQSQSAPGNQMSSGSTSSDQFGSYQAPATPSYSAPSSYPGSSSAGSSPSGSSPAGPYGGYSTGSPDEQTTFYRPESSDDSAAGSPAETPASPDLSKHDGDDDNPDATQQVRF